MRVRLTMQKEVGASIIEASPFALSFRSFEDPILIENMHYSVAQSPCPLVSLP